jgi:hypothetical protein
MAWISRVPADYIALLKQGDMMAEAVLAMFLVFLVLLEVTWWFRRLGREEVGRVVGGWAKSERRREVLQDGRNDGADCDEGALDGEWRTWFEWPVSMVGVLEEFGKFGS